MRVEAAILFRLVLSIVLVLFFLSLALGWRPAFFSDFDSETIRQLVDRAGYWGPIVIISLMALAIVASPLPSAPIALAAGAAYGHYFGAVYVAVGSELGAMLAFLIGRHLGRNAIVRLLGEKADYGLLGSQNALTVTVFITRLLPFVSFDAVSYASGLSSLHLWRFLLATIAGIIPASFVLAHFGAEAMAGGFGTVEWVTISLGFLTAISLLWISLRRTKPNP